MYRNLIEKMTWLRAVCLGVMVALVVILSVVDYQLLTSRPQPLALISQVEIPPEPLMSAQEPSILLDVPVYGGDDDGILDPDLVIGLPLAEYLEQQEQAEDSAGSDSGLVESLGSLAKLKPLQP